jgi:predicted ABC-type ATPase
LRTYIAGVNGAGKSTLYITNELNKNLPFVNSDDIVKSLGGDWRSTSDSSSAMMEAVSLIHKHFNDGASFIQETALSGSSVIQNIKKAKLLGYKVTILFVGLDNPDEAVRRVKIRAEQGGHGINEADIRRRYVAP